MKYKKKKKKKKKEKKKNFISVLFQSFKDLY